MLHITAPTDCPAGYDPAPAVDATLSFDTADAGVTGITFNGYRCTFERWLGCEVLLTCQFLATTVDLTYDPSAQTFSGASQSVCVCSKSMQPFQLGSCSIMGHKG
jgi:hypothetical protein